MIQAQRFPWFQAITANVEGAIRIEKPARSLVGNNSPESQVAKFFLSQGSGIRIVDCLAVCAGTGHGDYWMIELTKPSAFQLWNVKLKLVLPGWTSTVCVKLVRPGFSNTTV